jgi:steroid delta-isomerase-like uncharacterized protein
MNTKTACILTVAFLIIVPLGCQPAAEKQAESEKMFRDYCATWSPNPDIEKLLTYFTDDCIYENIPREQTYHGKDGVRAYVKACYDAIPDFKIEVTSVFASGDWLACEWVMTGTQTGVTKDFPGTGKSFNMRGSSIVQLKEGKIHRNADYWDMMTFLRQVGLIKS